MVAGLLWSLFVATEVIQGTGNALTDAYMRDTSIDPTPMHVISALAMTMGFLSTVAGTYFLCSSRRIVRHDANIPSGSCGHADDCCVSYWCGCCTLVQLFRQFGVRGNGYRPCTPDGSAETESMVRRV